MDCKLNIIHINVRSILPKYNSLRNYILVNKVDIATVSETWLNENVSDEVVSIEGYNLIRRDRSQRRGGGVIMYIRREIEFTEVVDFDMRRADQIWVKFTVNKISNIVAVLYRPPGFMEISEFFTEFEVNLSKCLLECENLICTGDFNLNMLNLECRYVQQFKAVLDAYNVTQIINEPTRVMGTSSALLDLILCSNKNFVVNSNVDNNFDVSDHFLIQGIFKLQVPKHEIFYQTYRDFKHFDHERFYNNLIEIPFHEIYYLSDIEQKLDLFNYLILGIFDRFAPVRTVRITKKRAPWLTPNLKYIMNLRDKALSKYKKHRGNENWESYKQLRNYVTAAVKTEKKVYLENNVRTNKPRENWKLLRELGVHAKKQNSVPGTLADVDKINEYFVGITQTAPDEGILNYYKNNKLDDVASFEFRMATTEEVQNALYSIKSRAIGNDKIGLNMLIYCCPLIIPVITHLVNYCIETTTFPNCWKIAQVLPLPKVSAPTELKDLRPISILPTLSKVAERIMNNQIKEYLNQYQILPATQSGFRSNYSCTTALLKVTDDILQATEKDELTVLILLDYSKAFDRLNHKLFISILNYLGLQDNAQRLIANYLSGRTQRVILRGLESKSQALHYGVPQGSILGPLFFSIYSSQLVKCMKYCTTHAYADDLQVYFSFSPSQLLTANNKINQDLDSLLRFSSSHCLSVNPDKSQVLVFGKPLSKEIFSDQINIVLADQTVECVTSARNLGVLLDTNLRFSQHINRCIQRAFCNLKLIYAQKSILTSSLKKMLSDSLVLSHFNYCDALYGPCLLNVDASRIQRIQNCCVRLIGGIRARDRGITAKLREINWLTMSERRTLHSLVLFNKIINRKSPNYLYEKVKFRNDMHNLDIRYKYTITPPAHTTALFERSFSYNIATLYNKVPQDIKLSPSSKFKIKIKENIHWFL